MSQSYAGHSFDFQESDATVCDVTNAVITKNKVTIEWSEDGGTGYLEATSKDGTSYTGTFGYPKPEAGYIVEDLRLYRAANGHVVLLGRWRWSSGENGVWLFRIAPKSA